MSLTVDKKFLKDLISKGENEVVEFKSEIKGSRKKGFGEYFAALSVEANLRKCLRAWLVLGVDDDGSVVGTDYVDNPKKLDAVISSVREKTGFDFANIHKVHHPNGWVILFEIPPAPRGVLVGSSGHCYGRSGSSLVALSQAKMDEIRNQQLNHDWSAEILSDLTVDDLDEEAIQVAKEKYQSRYRDIVSLEDIERWGTIKFLDKARITLGTKITRTALLLLGKPESSGHLNPYPAKITWDFRGENEDYEHFSPPFLLATTQLYNRIGNARLRILEEDSLVPHEISMYDQRVILEALHNCIAHQNFLSSKRIAVIEYRDHLIFENGGEFYQQQPDTYVLENALPSIYRNPFLVQAMFELKMIDQMGRGIRSIFQSHKERYLPMPDYKLEKDMVRLKIYGRIVDPAYTELLIKNTDLPISIVHGLDRVQKKLPISDDLIAELKERRLIEGRKPNYYVSASMADATETRVEYIHTRGQDDEYYRKLIVDYLQTFEQSDRATIDKLLDKKLSDILSAKQKSQKISRLLSEMRRDGIIRNHGSNRKPIWKLTR